MKTNKINALEAVIAALEISESELAKWFNNRGKDKTGLIPTELPLVYRRGNELTVENGLNLSRKSELWGIQLLSGVMVALTCGSGNNVSETTWGKVKKFAEKMTFNGKPGILPSKDVLKNIGAIRKKQNLRQRLKFWKRTKLEPTVTGDAFGALRFIIQAVPIISVWEMAAVIGTIRTVPTTLTA